MRQRLWATALIGLSLLAGCGGGADDPVATGPGGAGLVTTPPSLFTVGGVLAGLGNGKSVVVALANGAGVVLQNASLSANGAYTVSQIPAGTTFNLSIATQPVGQTCTLTNGSGTVSANTNSVRIDCADNRYTIGGSVSGNAGVVYLRNSATGEDLSKVGNGTFTFATPVPHASAYSVSLIDTSVGQNCSISNASGSATATVTSVIVSCAEPPPATPTNLTVSYSAKSYVFAWSASASATHYELLEDPDGAAAQAEAQVATITSTSTASITATHSLAPQLLHKRLNATYKVRACNANGCSVPTAALAPNLTAAIGYFKASNTDGNDQFGYSVALSADGNTLAVGAWGEDSNSTNSPANNSTSDSGAVYVFTRSAGTWGQLEYFKRPTFVRSGDRFGYSLALSANGSVLAVGAPGDDGDSGSVANRGAVHLYRKRCNACRLSSWQTLTANLSSVDDNFGTSVALSADGTTLAVGAVGEDSYALGVWNTNLNFGTIGQGQFNNQESESGAVYVFGSSSGSWIQEAYIKASNTEADDKFGTSVALSTDGNTLAVGAVGEDANPRRSPQNNNLASDSGAVYVFTRSSGAWSQQAFIKANNGDAGHEFGTSVALSADGNTLAVGAWREDGGAVYVFTRSVAAWGQQAYIKASNYTGSDRFGTSVALSDDGNTLAVGACWEDNNATGVGGNQAGTQASNTGAVYVFTRSSGVWSQQAYIKASNGEANDWFGTSVALSADGNTLAVGARYEASNATGVGGDQTNNSATSAGAVYLY